MADEWIECALAHACSSIDYGLTASASDQEVGPRFLRITEHLGRAAANGQRVMDRLFDHPIVSVAVVRDWLGLTPAGANQIVNRLEGIGLLREITGYARNRRFRFEPYLRLFEETGEETA